MVIVFLWGGILTGCLPSEDKSPNFPFSSTKEVSAQEKMAAITDHSPAADISFTNITVENGLAQNTVECIYQDSLGFIWICTHEGIDRFDGYEFVNLHHDPQDAKSLSDNVVYAISEDQFGNFWLGTRSGLDHFNPSTDELNHISLESNTEDIRENTVVTSLLTDHDGDVWVGTNQGIYRIHLASDAMRTARHYTLAEYKSKNVNGTIIGTIYQDSQSVIWAGTQFGMSRYDPVTDTFLHVVEMPSMSTDVDQAGALRGQFTAELINPFTVGNVVTKAILEIEKDKFLLGGDGLTLYDAGRNTSTSLKEGDIFYPSSITELGFVWYIVQDITGMIWIGMDTGLIRMDPVTFKSVSINQFQEGIFSRSAILSMFEDREGNIWIGTLDQGIYVYPPLRQKFANLDPYLLDALRGGNVWSLFEDSRGYLWVGTDLGLLRIDRKLHKVYPYQFHFNQEGFPELQSIRAITEDRFGNVWAGSTAGYVYIYDRVKGIFARKFEGLIPEGIQVNCLHIDKDGDAWIGTNLGLYWHQPGRDQLHHFTSDPQNPDSLSHDGIIAIAEDENGTIWIGTWDGLNAYNKTNNRFSRLNLPKPNEIFSKNNAIFSILPDHSGGLWLGSQSGGLHHFNIETGNLTRHLDAEGLTAGLIFSILEDAQGDLWLSTQRGLSMFNPALGIFTNYSHEDGLPSNEFNRGAYFQSSTGEMFFGSIDGFVSFYPENVLRNPHPPKIALTEITQSGEKIASDIAVDHLEEISLSWPNNFFEFEFASLSYTKPDNNQYAYYLEGIDPDWVLAGKNRRGRYVNLPGGRYTLHLIGSNNDGLWSPEGKKIQIIIIPPIWQRLWFLVAVSLGMAAIVLAGYRYRVRSILSRSNELEGLVDERTSELSATNLHLIQEISEREKTEQRLAQRIASEAVLTERNRLARDLHDAVTQTIFSASILSETLPHSLEANPEKGKQQIEELQRLTRGALAELRALLIELRPEGLLKTDLKELLYQLCTGIMGRTGIPVELKCDTQVDIPSEIKITLYRIAQEALNNAIQHADPSRIIIHCSSGEELIRLSIQDDGKGFNTAQEFESRLGLGIMKERATDIGANLEVHSRLGEGTTITVEWLFPKIGDTYEG